MRLLSQQSIEMNEDGDLVFSLFGDPAVWREVEPYVWRHENGYERMSAVLTEDGELDYVTYEPVAPIIHMSKAPWYRDSNLVLPVVTIAVIALLLTLVLWPLRAIVRWRYRSAFHLSGREAWAYRLTRVAIILVFIFLIAWMLAFQTLFSNLSGLSGGFITQLRITQFTQFLLYAALALSVWNIWTVWTGAQSWFAKLWSVVVALAILVILGFAATNGLLSFSTSF